jgi:hypothetical protein
MLPNAELLSGAYHFQPPTEATQRANQENVKYIDGTCTYMCGAPLFEFGLWPYVPHITVIGLCTIFLVLYKSSIDGELPVFTSYLVLGMGFALGLLIIVGLCAGTSRSIEDFSRRKTQRNKQVLKVEGDEQRRGYTMDRTQRPGNPAGIDSTVRRRAGGVGTMFGGNTVRDSSSAIVTPTTPFEDLEARGETESREREEYGEGDYAPDLAFSGYEYTQHQKKQYQVVTRAATSKLVEAGVMMALVFGWMMYGILFGKTGKDLFPLSVDIGLAVVAFGLTQTSYIQSWYDNIVFRYITFGIWASVLLIDPTTSGNVPSCESVSMVSALSRLAIFFVVYCLVEADTTAQINYWLRFCNRKKLIRNLPKLVSPPIEQIDTPGNRRIYAIQRIIFQSMYTLFLPLMVWPFALLHVVWLVYRIRITIAENNEAMAKKYEDISITSMMGDYPQHPETPRSQDRESFVMEDTNTSRYPMPTMPEHQDHHHHQHHHRAERLEYPGTQPFHETHQPYVERKRAPPASEYGSQPLPHHHLGDLRGVSGNEYPGSQGGLIPVSAPVPNPVAVAATVPQHTMKRVASIGPSTMDSNPGMPEPDLLLPEKVTPTQPLDREAKTKYPPAGGGNPPSPMAHPTFRPRGQVYPPPGSRPPSRRVKYIRIRGPPPRGATRVPRGFLTHSRVPGIPGRGVPSSSVPRDLSRVSRSGIPGRMVHVRSPGMHHPSWDSGTVGNVSGETTQPSDREEYPLNEGGV